MDRQKEKMFHHMVQEGSLQQSRHRYLLAEAVEQLDGLDLDQLHQVLRHIQTLQQGKI